MELKIIKLIIENKNFCSPPLPGPPNRCFPARFVQLKIRKYQFARNPPPGPLKSTCPYSVLLISNFFFSRLSAKLDFGVALRAPALYVFTR